MSDNTARTIMLVACVFAIAAICIAGMMGGH
jgi:hypothetical protein